MKLRVCQRLEREGLCIFVPIDVKVFSSQKNWDKSWEVCDNDRGFWWPVMFHGKGCNCLYHELMNHNNIPVIYKTQEAIFENRRKRIYQKNLREISKTMTAREKWERQCMRDFYLMCGCQECIWFKEVVDDLADMQYDKDFAQLVKQD